MNDNELNQNLLQELSFSREFFDIFEKHRWSFIGDQYKDLILAYQTVKNCRAISIGEDEEEG